MKKVLLALLLLTSTSAFAQYHQRFYPGYHGYGHYRYYPRPYVIGPFIGGAVLGAGVGTVIYDSYNRPIVVEQPPVYVEPQVVQPQVIQPSTMVYDCVDNVKPGATPGTNQITRTCTQRNQ